MSADDLDRGTMPAQGVGPAQGPGPGQRPGPQPDGGTGPGGPPRDGEPSAQAVAARAAPPPQPSRRTVLAGALGAGAVLAAGGAAAGPRLLPLGEVHGDPELADALRPHLDGHHRVAVVVDDGRRQRFAGFGAQATTEFEIGSVTKTFTGALLLDAVERGEVTLETTVADLVGSRADGSEAADVTLLELASQSSGLPRLPAGSILTSLVRNLLRRDPYRGTSAESVIDAALEASLSDRGDYGYSNLGLAALGQLLAARAGTTWQELLRTRLLEPLGMHATRAPFAVDELDAEAPRGRTASGLSAGAWTLYGYGPAGGIRSTAQDMGAYLRSMIDGTNPGAAGLEPVTDRGEDRAVGVVWQLRQVSARAPVVHHNGMTGGFAAFCGLHRETGRAIVLMTASARSLDEPALGYLDGSVTL